MNSKRESKLESFCELESIKERADIERNTHISLRNGYIYFQVSKAASSTVKYYLQYGELEPSPWRGQVLNVNKKQMSPHLSPFQVGDRRFIAMLNDKSIRKITFVRNPYSRLLSCYLHRIVRQPKSRSGRMFAKQAGIKDVSRVSFERFIDVVSRQESKEQESHWRVQYDDVMGSFVEFDFVGKVENLNGDIEKLITMVFGENSEAMSVGKKNLAPMVTGANSKLKEYYNDRLMQKVVDRYEMDFVTFGYSQEID